MRSMAAELFDAIPEPPAVVPVGELVDRFRAMVPPETAIRYFRNRTSDARRINHVVSPRPDPDHRLMVRVGAMYFVHNRISTLVRARKIVRTPEGLQRISGSVLEQKRSRGQLLSARNL